jgi:hypothetical protein
MCTVLACAHTCTTYIYAAELDRKSRSCSVEKVPEVTGVSTVKQGKSGELVEDLLRTVQARVYMPHSMLRTPQPRRQEGFRISTSWWWRR